MRVRCPACRKIHSDPPPRFTCAECGRRLAWSERPLWLPEQLTLFVPPGGHEQATLPLAGGPPEAAPARPEARQLSHLSRSIAMVTALVPDPSDGDALPAVLADQDPEELLSLTLTTAWLASALVRLLDEAGNGAGTAWLQGIALGLAQDDD